MYHNLEDDDLEKMSSEELVNNIKSCFDGSDYDQGALEDAARTASKTAEGLAKLISTLRDKKILSNEEIKETLKYIF